MSKFSDLIGQQFGRLEVIEYAGKNKHGQSMWLCKCNCKNKSEIIVLGYGLKSGNTKSCGCLVTKHGHTKNGKRTGFYRSWVDMIQRCINSNHKNYQDYGGQGITVCDEWLIFTNFERDNPGWEPGLTLERRKNELGYFPGNCYWATRKEQARNRRSNHLITFNGKTQCVVAWSEETGIPYKTLYARFYKYHWSIEKALTTSVKIRKRKIDR